MHASVTAEQKFSWQFSCTHTLERIVFLFGRKTWVTYRIGVNPSCGHRLGSRTILFYVNFGVEPSCSVASLDHLFWFGGRHFGLDTIFLFKLVTLRFGLKRSFTRKMRFFSVVFTKHPLVSEAYVLFKASLRIEDTVIEYLR